MLATVCFSVFFAIFLSFSVADDAGFPQSTAEENLTFVFYSRKQPEGHYVYTKDTSDLHRIRGLFDPTHTTVVLVHGWQDGYGADSNTYVREAILDKIDANIIKVCWRPFAVQDYFSARDAVPVVGRITATFLQRVFYNFAYPFDRVTLVGFSLGAHVAGQIGKNLPGKVPRIIGLDPAGPLIDSTDLLYSLNKADGQYVTAIHTNGGVLGMAAAVGHSDFYPNGGRRQPGCGLDILGGCAHNRAWELFAESINKSRFSARKCSSYESFQNDQCFSENGTMGGLNLDIALQGTFYLNTNAASPYGQGTTEKNPE